MKIRNGFISNSSSSSFIVNCGTIFEIPSMPKNLKDPTTLHVPQTFGGEIEFGRQRENYDYFSARLNWAFLQARLIEKCYKKDGEPYNKEWWERNKEFAKKHNDDVNMLEEVLLENIPGIKSVQWNLDFSEFRNDEPNNPKRMEGYIDHQSTCFDYGKEQYKEIFTDKESLFQWLFGVGNFIANRSDEYEDAGNPEVDHTLDYSDWDDYND